MNTVDFLDAVKRRHGLRSDYALSKFLGWRTQRVYAYRHTERELDDEGCVQIAAALELPPAYVMACMAASRAKSTAIKKHWLEAAKLLKTGTAAVILVTAGLLSQGAPAPGKAARAVNLPPYTLCARWRGPRPARPRRRRRRNVRRVTPIVAART